MDEHNSITKVFVYGTLKPNGRFHNIAQQGGNFSATAAYCEGFRLYHFKDGNYPAIAKGNDRLHGYLFDYETIDKALVFLDELEGLNENPPEYERQRVTAYSSEGSSQAYIYVIADPSKLDDSSNAVYLPEGNWQQSDEANYTAYSREDKEKPQHAANLRAGTLCGEGK